MDINAAWEAKRPALRLIFEAGRNNKRELEFEHFKTTAGPDLDSFATWCLCFEVWGAPWGENRWFFEKTIDDPAVRQLVEEHHDLFEFNRWLQWIAAEQVNAAQQEALDHGMTLGLMQDMAVGVHGLGADAWANPERFASGGVTVGCPPDFYNQQGQDWGQPPFNPRYLEATGYQVYREMVHSMYEHAGAVRIDHVLGLFRLWWIPQGLGARNGAYVTYNHEAMLGVLAIEATRAGGMVVGEDLGTVPDYVRRILADHGVLGTDVEWFNRRRPVPCTQGLSQTGIGLGDHARSAPHRRLPELRTRQAARGAASPERAGGGIRRLGDGRAHGHDEPSGGERLYLADRGG